MDKSKLAPITRIVARYISGALVMAGVVGAEAGDALTVNPDFLLVIGLAVGAIAETAYAFARKHGWAT